MSDEVIRPYPDSPQERFVRSSAFEVLGGGAAGGGKTVSLLMAAAQSIANPRHRAILFRRTFPELRDSLLPASWLLYQPLGATYANKTWTFPSGATIDLRSMEHAKDRFNFASGEWSFCGFDQLEQFERVQYEFMISRLRTIDPALPVSLRATANPIGPHVGWVLERFRWWLYRPGEREEEHAGPYLPPGKAAFIVRDRNTGVDRLVKASEESSCSACGVQWSVSSTPPPATLERCRHVAAQTRCFIPSWLRDNPALAATDYASRLEHLDPFTRSKLLEGDWMSEQRGGGFFRSEWFEIVEALPPVRARVRYWDRAATEASAGSDPAWTAGALVAYDGRCFYVEDMARMRGEPAAVEAFIVQTAALDRDHDPRTVQVLEQDPGQAGKVEIAHLTRALAGHAVWPVLPSGDKVTRAAPVASQASAGNVKLVRGGPFPAATRWIGPLLGELSSFPAGRHKDQCDAISGGVGWLSGRVRAASSASYRARGERGRASWSY